MSKNMNKILFILKKNFKFKKIPYLNVILESSEHFIEFKERIFQFFSLSFFYISSFFFSLDILCNFLIRILPEIKFFQLSPQEFFFTSFLISFNFSFLLILPFLLKIVSFFFSASLILKEKKIFFPLIAFSIIFSFFAIFFSVKFFLPLTFQFFLDYNSKNIEPFWSFNEFSTLFFKLIYLTILLFQIPLIQILISFFKIFPIKNMIESWKIIVCFAFLISGLLTPTIDPFTQIFLSLTICFLYSLGIIFSKIIF